MPPELAETARADRTLIEAQRAEIRKTQQEIERRKRAARKAGDQELLTQLDAFSRRFAQSVRRPGSLDRYPA